MSNNMIPSHQIIIPESIMEDEYYFTDKFDEWHAYIDLYLLANSTIEGYRNRSTNFNLEIGQISWRVKELAKRWKWTPGKVHRFINKLSKDGLIDKQKIGSRIVITFKPLVSASETKQKLFN